MEAGLLDPNDEKDVNKFDAYFTNPGVLNRMKNKYGEKACENIKRMTSIKLKRKILE